MMSLQQTAAKVAQAESNYIQKFDIKVAVVRDLRKFARWIQLPSTLDNAVVAAPGLWQLGNAPFTMGGSPCRDVRIGEAEGRCYLYFITKAGERHFLIWDGLPLEINQSSWPWSAKAAAGAEATASLLNSSTLAPRLVP